MIDVSLFPNLTPLNHRVTSPPSTDYNCIGWAVGDTTNWWQPGLHWPWPAHPLDESLDELRRVFEALGFRECLSADLVPGVEKVALYADVYGYTHAARQLENGTWTSKLGNEEDIEHDAPEVVAGGIYGRVALLMSRPSSGN
jgi:hypothetical protein